MFSRAMVHSLIRISAGLKSSGIQLKCALPRCLEISKDISCNSLFQRGSTRALSSSSSGTKKKGSDKALEYDPYLNHRINFEKAKAALQESVKPGMTDEQLREEVEKAYAAHIPPVPHWSVSRFEFDVIPD